LGVIGRKGAFALLISVAAGLPGWAQPAGDPPAPNFWDPRSNVERPAPGTIKTIRFITTSDYPPFNFVDASGRLTGFNVDLARAICKQLSAACTIQARPWTDLVAALEEGRADAAIAGVAINEETLRRVSFTDVYLRSPARFAVRRDRPLAEVTPEALQDRTIGVVAKSAHEAFLAAFFPEARRQTFDDADDADAALKDGKVDAVFGDGIQLSFWFQGKLAEECCTFAGGPYLESRFFGDGYAIAVNQKSIDLKRAMNGALLNLQESGGYAELYHRYFPIGFF
jgi:polar amino acid transport system substrate-binding protein